MAQLQHRADQGRQHDVSGNYQSGISVVDFTNPAAPKEIAYADPAPLSADAADVHGGDWSTYWHNGKIYESDICRGLIIWELDNAYTKRRAHGRDLPTRRRRRSSFAPDNVAPTIAIAAPVEGAGYLQNSESSAGFSCADADAGVESCVGTVADGAPIDTSHDRLPHVHGHGDRQGRQHDDEVGHVQRRQHGRRRHRGRHGAGARCR